MIWDESEVSVVLKRSGISEAGELERGRIALNVFFLLAGSLLWSLLLLLDIRGLKERGAHLYSFLTATREATDRQ